MILIIHTNSLTFDQATQLERAFAKPEKVANHYQIHAEHFDPQKLEICRGKLQVDFNLISDDFNPTDIKLVISDMDSTLIAIECIDEIADMLNLKAEVSAITEAAMRGELQFEESLRRRVALLEGLDVSALERVYEERLKLNPGAEVWLSGLKQRQIDFALVSGGFTFFTDRLHEHLALDHSRSNELAVQDGKLTGEVDGDIIGAQAKADFLHELCQQKGIQPHQVIAVGDGANDLLMMREAGLSVAYHAKPAVQAQAMTALNVSGLDAVLDFLNVK